MTMAYTKEELEAQRRTLKRHLDLVEKELAGNDGGGGTAADLKAQVTEQDELASLYDRLPAADITKMYNEDRDQWQKMMDAVSERSVRQSKLFDRSRL